MTKELLNCLRLRRKLLFDSFAVRVSEFDGQTHLLTTAMRLFLCTALLVLPATAFGQAPACADPTVHFEFQVSPAARWLGDTTLAVHPTVAIPNASNVIQFVVDTLGTPETRTFRALKVADSALVDEAWRTFAAWRYTPALLNGCRVRQLVQTPISR